MIRIGRISKVDVENGMASVTYEDKDDLTTDMLPILKPFLRGANFKAPKAGEYVCVAHTDNNPSRGVILGWYYNGENPPEE